MCSLFVVDLLSRCTFLSFSQTLREEVNAKLQKINTLIGNAAEIQKKYQAVADQNSQKCECTGWLSDSTKTLSTCLLLIYSSNFGNAGKVAFSKMELGRGAEPAFGVGERMIRQLKTRLID